MTIKIAVDAVSALGAKISGIDLIIENIEVPAANKMLMGLLKRTLIHQCICISIHIKENLDV